VRRFTVLLAALVTLLGGAVAASAQTTEVAIVDVNLSRYDDGGRVTMVVEFRNLTTPLDPAQLQVTVDGQPVENLEIQPISQARVAQGVVLVIDKSGSMQGEPIEAAKEAARTFVGEKRPEDFIALVTFDDEVQVLSNFTNSTTALLERIDSIEAEGGTAMFDAVIRAANLYATAGSNVRRNMIILTDGADENSAATVDDAIAAVTEFGVRTFGVALESEAFTATDLARIVDAGDGILLTTTDPQELADLYGQIRRELDNTLVVRFNAGVNVPSDVTFAVAYADLTAQTTTRVPGFVTTTTAGPTTTQTYPEPTVIVVENPLPVDTSTMQLIVSLAAGVALALLLFILFGGNRDEEAAWMRRIATYGRRQVREEKPPLLERLPLLGRFTKRAEEVARRRGVLGAINATLEQGNIPMTAGEAIAAVFGIAFLAAVLVGLFTFSLVSGAIAGIVVLLVAAAVIRYIGAREKRRFEEQLPDTLTLLSTSLRAGYSLLQAIEAVAQEAPEPTAREFGRAIAEARLGRPVVDALQGIVDRTQSQDFAWAVMAIEIQREVGGNLSEVLQTVADTMRARNQLKGEIRALTAEGRISAIVLGALPFALGLFLWTTNPDYLRPLFENTFGLISIGVGLLLMAGGIFWLRKIVNIEV
jgi:tight adherence protein B